MSYGAGSFRVARGVWLRPEDASLSALIQEAFICSAGDYLSAGLNKDGLVNLPDLTMFANDYLGCTDPASTQWPCENLLDYVKR